MKLIETDNYKIIAEHIEESITGGEANPPYLTDAGCKILQERYLQKDDNGKPIETYTELFIRVAATVAIAETNYGTIDDAKKYGLLFYNMMARMDFLPNSPIFKGAGLGINCAACYVLDIEDSRESIFRVLTQSVEIQAFGGGVGYNFSNLRERGSRIKSTGGISSGPVSFMKIFDLTIGQVITQGGVRNGAQMGILMYNHPDIIEFIESKKTGSLTNFNISVGITEEFMKLAQANEDFDIISPLTGKVGTYNAGKLLDFISQNAHETGDPGILFMDRIESFNPVPSLGPLGLNPCGESNLQNFENCTLGSINIANFVIGNEIDYDRLDGTIELAVRFLDNVIDINDYPIPEIETAAKGNRKIGLGIMGWADALVKMGIKYDSTKGIVKATYLMHKLNEKAELTSMQLGKEKGVFPNYNFSIYINKNYPDVDVSLKRRNASLTMIAPTGTLGTIADVNGGIEPFFLLAYKRGSLYKDGKPTVYIDVVNKYLNEYINNLTVDTVGIAPNSAITDRDFIIESIVKKLIEHGSIQDSNIFPELESVKDIYVTSHDIHYKWHLEMQRAFQKHCEMGISKTVNMAHNATIDDVKNIYIEAYKGGYIKGVTVYRDGCKEHQVLTKIDQTIKVEMKLPNSNKRPNKLPSFTHLIETPVGKLYTTVAIMDGHEYEVFLNIGKAGADITACAEGYGRLLSLMFKYGIPLSDIVHQLSGIGGSNSVGIGPKKVKSLPDGISQVLDEYVISDNDRVDNVEQCGDICPACGHMLIHVEGCTKCKNCDYSKC